MLCVYCGLLVVVACLVMFVCCLLLVVYRLSFLLVVGCPLPFASLCSLFVLLCL